MKFSHTLFCKICSLFGIPIWTQQIFFKKIANHCSTVLSHPTWDSQNISLAILRYLYFWPLFLWFITLRRFLSPNFQNSQTDSLAIFIEVGIDRAWWLDVNVGAESMYIVYHNKCMRVYIFLNLYHISTIGHDTDIEIISAWEVAGFTYHVGELAL